MASEGRSAWHGSFTWLADAGKLAGDLSFPERARLEAGRAVVADTAAALSADPRVREAYLSGQGPRPGQARRLRTIGRILPAGSAAAAAVHRRKEEESSMSEARPLVLLALLPETIA